MTHDRFSVSNLLENFGRHVPCGPSETEVSPCRIGEGEPGERTRSSASRRQRRELVVVHDLTQSEIGQEEIGIGIL